MGLTIKILFEKLFYYYRYILKILINPDYNQIFLAYCSQIS
jgi:hypothetical protein